jgi:hypothetical protein
LARIRQVSQIQQDQWTGSVRCREVEPEERGMLRRCHLRLYSARQLDRKVARARFHGLCLVFDLSLFLRKLAAIYIVAWTRGVRKESEVSQGGATARAAVVHGAEASHASAFSRKATLIASRIDIGNGFCHAIWQSRTSKDITCRVSVSMQEQVSCSLPPLALPIN